MAEFVKVATKGEIPAGGGKVVEVGGTPVAVFNVEGKFFALHNTCLHQGGPLGEGQVEDNAVRCPWHGWRYDLSTGKNLTVPDSRVARFSVKVEGDDLLVSSEPLQD